MNPALSPPSPARAHQPFVRPFRGATLGWFIASAVFVSIAVASMPFTVWAADLAEPAPAIGLLSVPAALATGTSIVTRGIVESVRSFEVSGAAPAGYELTVRWRDGTRRTTSHSDSADWHVGDSIMLIGRAKLPSDV